MANQPCLTPIVPTCRYYATHGIKNHVRRRLLWPSDAIPVVDQYFHKSAPIFSPMAFSIDTIPNPTNKPAVVSARECRRRLGNSETPGV